MTTNHLPALRLPALLALLLMLACAAPGFARQNDAFSPASLAIEPARLHVGDVRPGQTVTRSVTLTNNASRDLVLLRTATSCACTVPDLGRRRTLAPGESFELPITYTGFDAHFGETGQQVVVFVEGFSIPTQIAIMANINRGIRATVEFTPPDQSLDAEITLESIDGRAFGIEWVDSHPPVYADGFDPSNDEPRSRYTIRQQFAGMEPETIPPYLLIVTDDPDSPVMSIRVLNTFYDSPRIQRPFLIQGEPVLIHAIPASGVTEVEIQLMAVRGEAHSLLNWFEARSDHAGVSLLGVRVEPERSLAYLRLGVRPNPTHRGHIAIHVWATIGEHTEHTVLHGRVFAPEALEGIAAD